MDTFFQDLKHSVRMFAQSKAFTATTVAALALGLDSCQRGRAGPLPDAVPVYLPSTNLLGLASRAKAYAIEEQSVERDGYG